VPIINANKTDRVRHDRGSRIQQHSFRLLLPAVAPDLDESYAMVAIAQQKHYSEDRAGVGNDIGSQTFVQPAMGAIGKAGMSWSTLKRLTCMQTRSVTEAAKIVAAAPGRHPHRGARRDRGQPFSARYKQLNGGTMIPIIGTSANHRPGLVHVGVLGHWRGTLSPTCRRQSGRRARGPRYGATRRT